jgi:predicted DNA-binding transcriptional regulator AlpA
MTKQKLPTGTAPMDAAATPPSDTPPDNLIPDPVVCAEFGVTAMTLWRWTRDTALNFPPPIAIRNRNFRSRRQLEAFKERMLRKAIRQRRGTDQHQAEDNDDADQGGRDGVAA